jgi:predicted nicotinamide N-methyase
VITEPEAFIRAHTRLLAPPHCPELQLHLADALTPLWEATEEELGRLGLAPPFWAFAWAGGQALARYVLDEPALVRGRAVLDLASGSGLVAIAALKAGAASALAADIDPYAAHAARLNAKANGVELATTTEDVIGTARREDVLLVGDLFYDRDLSPLLLAWLQALAQGGRIVRVGDPGRSYFDRTAFEQLAEYRVPTTRLLEDAEVKRTGVWRLRGAA